MSTVVQSSFVKGELSQKVAGRIDIDQYGQGVSNAQNFRVLSQGPLAKRSGTGFINRTKVMSNKSCTIPFVFSDNQAYVLEFGDRYIRFFALRGQVFSGGVPYEIVSPYNLADLYQLEYLEINDIIYLAHNKYPVQKLIRHSELNWTIGPVSFFNGPYMLNNSTGTSLTPSNTGKPAGSSSPAAWFDSVKGSGANLTINQAGWYSFSGGPVAVNGYAIYFQGGLSNGSYEDYASATPRCWTFEGQPAGTSNWVTLDSRVGESGWIAGETRNYEFTNNTVYQAYRLLTTVNNGYGDQHFGINELYLAVRDFPMTLTFSSVVGINSDTGFSSKDIGRFIRFQGSDGFFRCLKITHIVSTTVVDGLFYGLWMFDAKPTVVWALGAFSEATGYPAAISEYEGRMALGGSTYQPRGLWMSASNDLENFAPDSEVIPSSPINVTLSGNQQNAIKWLSPGKGLFAGTTDGVLAVSASSDGPLAYNNIKQTLQTNFGSGPIRPVRVGPAVLYASYHANCIRELLYAFADDAYDAPDITLLSEHLFITGINQIAWSRSPDEVLYIVVGSGKLISLTYDRIQKVVGITPYVTDGLIESVSVIPGINGLRDDVYVQVQRTVNGQLVRYIEYLEDPFFYQDASTAWFVDCGLRYSGAPTNVITGLSHLEGKFVAVQQIEQGVAVQGTNTDHAPAVFGATVLNGSITLPVAVTVSNVVVGLPYTAYLTLLRSRVAANDGQTMFSRRMRIDRLVIDMFRTAGLEIQAPDAIDTWEDVLERSAYNQMDNLLPLYTGQKDIAIEGSWRGEGVVTIRSQYPLPAMIRAVVLKMDKEA